MRALRAFAAHTGLPLEEGDESLTSVARKYLAVHVNVVPARLSYAHVASDFDLLEMHAQNPPLSSYAVSRTLDAEALVWIMRNTSAIKTNATLATFCAEALACQPRSWKDGAYLLALATARGQSPQFRSLIKAIYDADNAEQKGYFPDVYNAVKRHVLPMSSAGQQKTAADIGAIIASINLPHTLEDAAGVAAIEIQPVAQTIASLPAGKIVITPTAPTISLADLRSQLEPFRKRALLPPLAQPRQVALKFLLEQASAPGARSQEDAELVSRILRCPEFSAAPAALAEHKEVLVLSQATNRSAWDTAALVQHLMQPETVLNARTLQRFRSMLSGSQTASGEALTSILASFAQ